MRGTETMSAADYQLLISGKGKKAKTAKKAPVACGDKPISVQLQVPPLSVNKCWKGQRFKTDDYKAYEKKLLFLLPAQLPPHPPYRIQFEFGFSNTLSDWDNPVKPLQDIMQTKYGFNDKDIQEAKVVKKKVPVGQEYFKVIIETIHPQAGL